MDSPFQISARFSQGNLHLDLSGDFDGHSAGILAAMLEKTAPPCRSVFLNTDRLDEVELLGGDAFKRRLETGRLDLGRLYFKGPRAWALAPRGSRVVEPAPPACRRACRKCASGRTGAAQSKGRAGGSRRA